MIKQLCGLAAASALAVVGLGAPAQAVTGADCGDGADWDWSVSTPARYQVDDQHTTVVGLSEAQRTVTILAPPGCAFDEGDRWQVFNGYFSASGFITGAEDGDTSDSDSVGVEVPSSNTVAGADITTRLRVNFTGTGSGFEVDKSSSIAPLNLLRRVLFKSGSTDDRVNFFPEPVNCGSVINGAGRLIRASWTSDQYLGYADRFVRAEFRTDPGSYSGNFIDNDFTDSAGNAVFADTVGDGDGPPCGGTVVLRGFFAGNGTSSGTVSTCDAVVVNGP